MDVASSDPAPTKKFFLAKGGRFTFSDDCHSVGQVGTNYPQLLRFATDIGLGAVECFGKASNSKDARFPNIVSRSVSLDDIKGHRLFE